MTTLLALLIALVTPTFATSTESYPLQVNQMARRYVVHTPPSYQRGKPIPVVISIHGGGGNTDATEASTRMIAHSDRSGYLLVYPEGTGKTFRGKLHATWNAGKCCASSVKNNIDDIAYFRAVIEDLKSRYSIDAKRIYATGLSNGGMMAYRIACEMSDQIAAIAPVGSQDVTETCTPKRHVPTINIHGMLDQCVPYGGGPGGDCFNKFLHNMIPIVPMRAETSTIVFPKVVDAVQTWAIKNGIPTSAKSTEFYRKGKTECSTKKGKTANEEVALCNVADGGHSWPGGHQGNACAKPNSRTCRLWLEVVGPMSEELDANEVIWTFFSRHSL